MAGYYSGQNLTIPGSSTGGGDEGKVRVASVAPDFLTIMEIPLLAGREFTAQDDQKAPGVVVVNQALAERYFPGQHPVGQRVSLNGKEMEVIGVARDAKYGGIREEIEPVAYLAYLQTSTGPPPEMSFAVRTVGDPAVAIAAIRQAVQSIDRNIPLFDVRSQREIISRGFARPRLFAVLSSFFGLLALALVCIGLYGVMSYSVSRRTREIGIRKALGARSGDILKIVLSETLILVAAGLVIGLGAALATTKMIESQLFGLAATDPLTIALAASILMITATVAGYLPARRATRVDPMVALRYE
jgi:predicted permease